MKEIIYLIFAVIPTILWVLYFYKHDKGEKEPCKFLIYAVILGAAVVIPAAFLELFVTKNLIPLFFPHAKVAPISAYPSFASFLIYNLIAIAIIEEVLKFLVIRFTVYRAKCFNEVADGIVYMVAAALGFAAFENFLYFLKFGQEVIFIRSLFTPLFHASASAIVGHYLGLAKWDKKFQKKVYLALICAIILHFVYNFLVFFVSVIRKWPTYTAPPRAM
jgi:RsiW-degrading membrane proteinase PrsW (M82 family)